MYYTYEEVDKCVIRDEVGYMLAKQAENVIETNRFGGYREEVEAIREYWNFVSMLNGLGAGSFKFKKPIDYEVRLKPSIFLTITEELRYLKENLHGVKEGENKKLDDRYRKLLTRVVNLDNNSLQQVDKLEDNL